MFLFSCSLSFRHKSFKKNCYELCLLLPDRVCFWDKYSTGAEDHVQKNQVSRKRIAILQGHSEDVGRGWIIMIVGPQIIVPAFQL